MASLKRISSMQFSIPTRSSNLTRMGGRVILIPKTPGKASIKYPVQDEKTGWTIDSVRTGAIGVKLGMTQDWDNFGVLRPLTLIHFKDVQVVQVKTEQTDGYTAMQIGAIDDKIKHHNNVSLGHYARAGIAPKKYLEEFRVTPDALLPVGTTIYASHFVPGQLINVTGLSRGKGFQGVVRRWGFAGGPATHGTSLSHRTLGATGARQDPGKVWKGKKMAGHMGNKRVHVPNLQVFEVFSDLNVLAVVGAVPGSPGTFLRVADALTQIFQEPPPFPTYVPEKPLPSEEQLDVQHLKSKVHHFSNPFHQHNPDLEEYYWQRYTQQQPQNLLNGRWEPDVQANLPPGTLEAAKKRLNELRKSRAAGKK